MTQFLPARAVTGRVVANVYVVRYRGWQEYLLLFAIAAAALIALACTDITHARACGIPRRR